MKRSVLGMTIVLIWLGLSLSTQAQTPPPRLLITVTDQTGAVIPGATVTVTPLDGSGARTPVTEKTNEKGQVTLEALTPGRHAIRGEFPAFDPGVLADVRIRPGENKQVVVLHLSRIQDSVTVARETSDLFGRPQAITTPRRIDLGMSFTF